MRFSRIRSRGGRPATVPRRSGAIRPEVLVVAHGPVGDAELLGDLGDRPGAPGQRRTGVGAGSGEGAWTGLSRRPSCFTFTSTSSNRRAILGDHEGPDHVRAEQGPRGLPHRRARVRRGEQVAPHVAAVGPGPPLPGRPDPQDGRPRAVRPGRAGGVRRRRSATSPPCAWRSRSSAGSTSRSASPCRPGVGLGINPILTYGTEEQKQRWLPDLVAGRALAAFGLTEPDAGSDAGATRTKARLGDGDASGSSTAPRRSSPTRGTDITSRGHGDGAHRHERRTARREIAAILVPARHTRVHRRAAPTTSSAGTPPTPTACPSPTAACRPTTCSARRGDGFKQFLKTLDDGRIAIRALAVGLAQACLEALDRLRQDPDRVRPADRRQPGRLLPGRRPRRHGRGRPHCSPTRPPGSRTSTTPAAARSRRSSRPRPIAKLYSTEAAVIGDPHRHAGLRRQRLHGGVPRRPVLP